MRRSKAITQAELGGARGDYGQARYPGWAGGDDGSIYLATVLFFRLALSAGDKGRSLGLMALGLAMFAIGHMVVLSAAGPLVDRGSGDGTITPSLEPMIGSFIIFTAIDECWLALM